MVARSYLQPRLARVEDDERDERPQHDVDADQQAQQRLAPHGVEIGRRIPDATITSAITVAAITALRRESGSAKAFQRVASTAGVDHGITWSSATSRKCKIHARLAARR